MNIEQRTPVPALGDGWYLLRRDEVMRQGDKFTACSLDIGWVDASAAADHTLASYPEGCRAARYFGPAKEPEPQPTTNPIDWTKPVRTKDGQAVRVLCTDGPNTMYPVIGVVCGSAATYTWSIDGKYCTNGTNAEINLENAPTRIQREYWVCVYPGDIGLLWESREEALRMSKDADPIAIVKITIDCEEGEGL